MLTNHRIVTPTPSSHPPTHTTTQLHYLRDGVFAGLSNLRSLAIVNSELREISAKVFEPLRSKLESLSLSFNRLRSDLPLRALLSPLQKLESLDVRGQSWNKYKSRKVLSTCDNDVEAHTPADDNKTCTRAECERVYMKVSFVCHICVWYLLLYVREEGDLSSTTFVQRLTFFT